MAKNNQLLVWNFLYCTNKYKNNLSQGHSQGVPGHPPWRKKILGSEYYRAKQLFAGSKIFSAGGQPPWKIPDYTPDSS